MEHARIMMLDLSPHACTEDHGGQLARLLHSLASAGVIDLQIITHWPSTMPSPSPDLCLLCPSVTEDMSKFVQVLRNRWNTVPILGLFCISEGTPAAMYSFLLKNLDDFLTCPFRSLDVSLRILQLLRGRRESTATSEAEEMKAHLHRAGIVGESDTFLRAIGQVLRVAHSDATVLLCGETGTGKELVARAVHYCSRRQDRPFVPVNCGALPEHLVENELFGHTKGAYTDASSPAKGLVAEAEGGTLFLDEVDTLSVSAQVKLLRFLQEREYRPVGSSKSTIANVRVIVATNADLWQLVQAKRFREDLYYRLHVIALRLPPLRERRDDIPQLALHFLCRYSAQYGRGPQQFSTAALRKLAVYPWPGNVRELETVVQRTVLLTSSSVLRPDDIELPLPYHSAMSRDESFRQAKTRVVEQFERSYLVIHARTTAGVRGCCNSACTSAEMVTREKRAGKRWIQSKRTR